MSYAVFAASPSNKAKTLRIIKKDGAIPVQALQESKAPSVLPANSTDFVRIHQGLTVPKPAHCNEWHLKVEVRHQNITNELRGSTPESYYRANEVEAVLARNQGKWADEGDEMHPGNVKLEGDNDPESTEYSIDGDVPWFYIGKGEETSGPRNDTMRPIVDRLNTDELRAEHEKQLSARIDEPRHHGLVHFDEEGNAWIRKSSIRFNTVVFVHGEQEASNNASTSVSAPKDIYKPSLENLSGGSIRSQIRPMRDFDQIHHDRACQVDVLAARKSIKRRYGRRSLPRQFRAETGALERAAAWHETLELQASYDTILNAKPDWPTERRRAFDKVTAKIAKDDETLHIQEQQAATRLTARFTGSMRGTIKLIKRVAPGIPSFTDSTDPTESIPLINTLYH